MTNTTLRQKFAMGCALVFIIVVMALLGGRLFGKAAWLYQVEREHLVQVLDMKVSAKAVITDSNAAQVTAGFFIDAIDKAKALTHSADDGLLGAEKLLIRLIGESEVLAFTERNLADLDALAALVPTQRSTVIDSATAASLLPAIQAIKASADTYVTHLSQWVEKASMIVHSINLLGGLALVAAILALRQRVLKPLSEAHGFANRIARGDLSVRKRTHPDDEFGRLMIALTDMQANLGSMVTNVTNNTTQIAEISTEFADGNLELNARMETQANALEQTASAMEELGSSAVQNSDSARRVNDLAVSASAEAVEGGKVVSSAIETMKGISAASREISDIIAVIDDIAFQTNILALNAAVEAARAGEQGRGFAVVASEVRSLAGRSAEAARQITTLIDTSVERVTQGEALVEQAGTTMTQVVESITSVTELIGGISSASNEQRIGVTDVGNVFSGMDEDTQHNARLVEAMASSAAQLKIQTQELVEAVSVFKLVEAPDRS